MTFTQLMTHAALAALVALGFAINFNLPRRHLPMCALMTMIAYASRQIMLENNIHLVSATFTASMLTSLIGVLVARSQKLPPKTLIVPSTICLMPGIAAYKAMLSIVQIGYFGFSMTLFSQMLIYFFEALFVICALVLGLSTPSLFFYRRRPIV